MATLRSLHDLWLDQLRDTYSAETQLVKALPDMARAATRPALQEAFRSHLAETKEQVTRLESVFTQLNESPKGKTCAAMEGLVEEAQELLAMKAEPEVLDAGLIAAAQKVEHYEIASYGTLCAWCDQLGQSAAGQTLRTTLNEEKAADQKLTAIAEQSVNATAAKTA